MHENMIFSEKISSQATIPVEGKVSDFVWNLQDDGITVRVSRSKTPLQRFSSTGKRETLPFTSPKLSLDGKITHDEKRLSYLATCGDRLLILHENQYPSEQLKVVSGKGHCLQGVVYLPKEDLYAVVDANLCQVYLLEAKTFGVVGQFGSKGNGVGQFQRPCNICLWPVGDKHRLVISDWGAHQLKLFDVQGNYIETIGKGQLRYPRGVCADRELGLVVADTLNQRVIRYWYANQLIKSEILLDSRQLGRIFIPWIVKLKRNAETIHIAVLGTNSEIKMFTLFMAGNISD